MRKRVYIWAVLVVFLSLLMVGCGDKKAAAPEPQAPAAKEESLGDLLAKGRKNAGMSYDYTVTGKDHQMTGKMWMEGKKIRSEITVQEHKMVTIMDGDNKVVYTYNPEQKTGMKISMDKAKPMDTVDRYTKETDPAKFKLIENTVYDGAKCRVLEMQNEEAKITTRLWIREDYGIPAKVEVTDPSGGKTVMEYKNIKIGPAPAGTFQVPADVKMTDMGDMMKQVVPQG